MYFMVSCVSSPTGGENTDGGGYFNLASPDDPELCDGIDNDGDGEIDEDFDVQEECKKSHENQYGVCWTRGSKQCTADKLGTECVVVEPIYAEPEILAANDTSCFDGIDNDCDDYVDGDEVDDCKTAEEAYCNGFDDDADGVVDDDAFGVGLPCTVGTGECQRTGTILCDLTDVNQQRTSCSVSAGYPGVENTPGKFYCVDGLDNDCDNLVDLADADCQQAEICDGVDNDGNDGIDEDFTVLGEACTVGIGACEVIGSQVCNTLGDATQCNVVARLPGTEGPSGPTCSDGIDNDCDGDVDGDDLNCSSADIGVSCRLISLKKNSKKNPPGTSCEEKFLLQINTNVGPQYLTAEVMGLNPDGSLIDFSPYPSTLPVKDGDELHFNSRLNPDDWKLDAKGRFIDVFAPVPLVRVTVDTGQTWKEAFCSHIPWMNVDQPSGQGQVVSASEGDRLDVVVPIPRVDPATLGIVVDGVNIFDNAHLDIDPATDFPNPTTPLGGTIDINGQMVTVSDLVVDAPTNLDVFGRNVLTMTLENLGGGGHIVVVNGDPRVEALPLHLSAQCHVDDILDAGTVSVFGITIQEPGENDQIPKGPTTVEATVSHGREIAGAQVHGKEVSVGSQTCSPMQFDSFGKTFSVDSCGLNIVEDLPQTDLSAPLQLGTIDIGQNILTVAAQDDLLNTTYAQRRFISGIGTTASPNVLALSPQARAAIGEELELELNDAFSGSPSTLQPLEIEVTADGVNFNLAFVFGITTEGINGFFQSVCDEAKKVVELAVKKSLSNAKFPEATIDTPFGICNPTVKIEPGDTFGIKLQCKVDSETDLLTVYVTIIETLFEVDVEGSCRTSFMGACISEVVVDVGLDIHLMDFGVEFGITEQLVEFGGQTPEDMIKINQPEIDITTPDTGVDIRCIAGDVVEVFKKFTGGFVDFEKILGEAVKLYFLIGEKNLQNVLHIDNPDPLKVQKIGVNDQFVKDEGLQVEQKILNVEITEGGVISTIGANFTVPLPEEENIQATVMHSPAPQFPIPNAKELVFGVSADIFNLLFAAIGLKGSLTTSCVPGEDTGGNPLTFEDTLPADCDTLVGDTPFQTNVRIGRCHGAKEIDCSSLTNPGQVFYCNDTQNKLASKNISKDTRLLFCARQPLAPRVLVKDDLLNTPELVEAEIHANDMKVTIILDRNGNGVFDEDQRFWSAPRCWVGVDVTKDCKWSDACFDMNLATYYTLGASTAGSAQIVRYVTGVSDSVGMQCAGGLNLGSGPVLLTTAGTSSPVDTIQENIQNIVQIFEPLGLNLGGLVGLDDKPKLRVISIDVPDRDDDCSTCAEYIAVTGDIYP